MKKLITLLFVLLFTASSFNSFAANGWMTSFEDAQKMAVATNKLILVDFWATWCGPCKRMDSESWSDEEVKALMANFIPLKIDIDTERTLTSRFSVNTIPRVYILDANGEVVLQSKSYMPKNRVMKLLTEYKYSTKYIQQEYLNFMKTNSGDNALKIAEKYFDFSIFVDDSVKNDFLNLGSNYLKMSYKLYKKEGQKKKHKQRMALYDDVYKQLLRGNYKKTLKELNKDFKETDILEHNKDLYTFIQYTAYMKLKDNDNAKIWYQKLKNSKEAKQYLLKARKI